MLTSKQIVLIGAGIPALFLVLMCGLCGGLFAITPTPPTSQVSGPITKETTPLEIQPAEPPAKPKEPSVTEAWIMAQDFVKGSLKSPSTASFGSAWSEYQKPEDHVSRLADGQYRVVGWVDSQNAFGATLRNRFALTMQYLGGDRWQCTEGPIFSEW